MKKRLLTLSMVSLLTIGLTSCSVVTSKKTADGEQVIVTIKKDGAEVYYTADDLLSHYASTETGIQAYYNAIYDILIRNDQEMTSEMETDVEEKVDEFINTCKTNASNNGTTYKSELSDSLEAAGVDSIGEYRELKELEVKKEKYESNFYDDNIESRTKSYIEEKVPYHIRHILVKTDDVDGSSVYNKEISKDESKKIYSVVSRLASSSESFGDIAYDASDDTSNTLYGSVGLMEKDTSFVSEFKFSVYYYDAMLSGKNDTGKSSDEVLAMLNVPTSVSLGSEQTLDTKAILDSSVQTIPYSAVKMLDDYADSTKTINNLNFTNDIVPGAERHEITSSYYPRNVLFNTYFNSHGLSFITDEGYPESTENNPNWTAPSAELKAVLGTDFSGKILTDNGNPILVTYNPSTGLHFMIIEKSPINQRFDNYTDYTDSASGTEVKLNNLEEELMHYYSLDVPSGSANVTNDNRFVTYIKTNRITYGDRADELKDLINGYDSNMQYQMFEQLLYAGSDDKTVRSDIQIDETILNNILDYIETKRNNTAYDFEESNLTSWTSYLQLLNFQKVQKKAKQLDFNETKQYFTDTKDL